MAERIVLSLNHRKVFWRACFTGIVAFPAFAAILLLMAHAFSSGFLWLFLLQALILSVITSVFDYRLRKTSLALIDENKLLQLILDDVSDSVMMCKMRSGGHPGCFFLVNDAAVNNLGYSRQELLSMTICDVTGINEISDKISDLSNDGVVVEQTRRRRDGSALSLPTSRRQRPPVRELRVSAPVPCALILSADERDRPPTALTNQDHPGVSVPAN